MYLRTFSFMEKASYMAKGSKPRFVEAKRVGSLMATFPPYKVGKAGRFIPLQSNKGWEAAIEGAKKEYSVS